MNDMTQLPPIQIGQLYQYDDGSPWPDAQKIARVIDLQDGWVRFQRLDREPYGPESQREADFRLMYREKP